MRKMINTLFLAILLVVLVGNAAQASIKIEDFYTTTSIFDIILLVCALICLLWSLRIMSLVRGGLMSKSWQMFVLGFCFLVIAQVFTLGENARLFFLPGYVSTALYLLMAIMWLGGLYRTRRILG
jgi:hypothetical protein